MISKPWLQLCPWLAVSVYWILCGTGAAQSITVALSIACKSPSCIGPTSPRVGQRTVVNFNTSCKCMRLPIVSSNYGIFLAISWSNLAQCAASAIANAVVITV